MEKLAYIYMGTGCPTKDDDRFLNHNLKTGKYFIDNLAESENIKIIYTEKEIEQAKRDLSNLLIDEDCIIPVGELDEFK